MWGSATKGEYIMQCGAPPLDTTYRIRLLLIVWLLYSWLWRWLGYAVSNSPYDGTSNIIVIDVHIWALMAFISGWLYCGSVSDRERAVGASSTELEKTAYGAVPPQSLPKNCQQRLSRFVLDDTDFRRHAYEQFRWRPPGRLCRTSVGKVFIRGKVQKPLAQRW